MAKEFTKKNLQTGDIIETRNGELGVVILEKDCILYQAGGLDELDVFTENLFVDGPEQIALRNTKPEDNYFLRLAAT